MNKQQKKKLLLLISKAKIQEVVDRLLLLDLEEVYKKKIYNISAQLKQFQQKSEEGTLSAENKTIFQNQITARLIEIITSSPQQVLPLKTAFPLINPQSNSSITRKKIVGLIGFTVFIIGLFYYVASLNHTNIPQLTIFVTDTKGNVILQHEGEINISIGNRSLYETIGQNGRINFGDILPIYLGDSIQIGFKAEGWELAKPSNSFVFTGNPIKIMIKKDNSLGVIKGSVRTRDGQTFLPNALVRINSDTSILTNNLGNFKIILPEKMQIPKENHSYILTVSKAGYITESLPYNPKSSAADFRLEKINQ